MLTALALILFYLLTAPAFWVIVYKRTYPGAAPRPSSSAEYSAASSR